MKPDQIVNLAITRLIARGFPEQKVREIGKVFRTELLLYVNIRFPSPIPPHARRVAGRALHDAIAGVILASQDVGYVTQAGQVFGLAAGAFRHGHDGPGFMEVGATNGHVAARMSIPCEGEGVFSVVTLPTQEAVRWQRFLEKATHESVVDVVSLGHGMLSCEEGPRQITLRSKKKGLFPDLAGVWPTWKRVPGWDIVTDRKPLLEMATSLVATDPPPDGATLPTDAAQLFWEGGIMKLKSLFQGPERVLESYQLSTITRKGHVGIKLDYLRDALQSLAGRRVRLRQEARSAKHLAPREPIEISSPDDPGGPTWLVMPLRLT